MGRLDRTALDRIWQAAEHGAIDAQYQLGLEYYLGMKVEQNLVTAHMWLNLAAAHGSEEARELRRDTAVEMDKGQIAMAQRLAREHLAQHRVH